MLVALICATVIFYPNFVCMCVRIYNLDAHTPLVGLVVYSALKFILIWAVFIILIRFNLDKIPFLSIGKRIAKNLPIIAFAYVINLLLYFGLKPYGAQEDIGSVLVFQYIIIFFMCVVLGHTVMLYMEQREKDIEIQKLRADNIQSRYDALTSRINPHFLFNSLNGISTLVVRKDITRTLKYVDELSNIFRYILQSEKHGVVLLADEIRFVEAFKYVMEVRFGDNLYFNCDKSVGMASNFRLPVLALLPVIDNVVVHNQIDDEHRMCVNITVKDDVLQVANPIYPRLSRPDTNGTGLNNISKRLKLLTGHDIAVDDRDGEFIVSIPLISPLNESLDC